MAEPYNWVYENNINSSREHLDIDAQEFKYNSWRTNLSMSGHIDTIAHANEMNLNYHLSDKMQYNYLFYSTRKQRRYGKKKTEEDKKAEKQAKVDQDTIMLIQDYYKYNVIKAKQAIMILSKEQINIIRKKQEKGG